jgi:tetratricopeptide (TPR) repeat protein
VVSFDNRTGSGAYDYLRDAIPNLLITSLEQSGTARVASWERMHDLLRQRGAAPDTRLDASAGLEICAREGIAVLVTGSFVKAGDTFITDARALDVRTRGLLRAARAEGTGAGSILTEQVDALSREIGRGLPLAPPAPRAAAVAGVTTPSLEAYNYFLRGRDELDRYNYSDARVFLSKAVELDPQFAMAWAYLGRAYSLLVDEARTVDCFSRAKALAGRAGEKERLMIDALHARYVAKDQPLCLKVLTEMAARFPEEKWVRYNIGLHHLYYARGAHPAIPEFERALDLDPGFAPVLNELAYAHADLEEYDRALELFGRYAAVSPGDPNPFDSMGDVLLDMGRIDEAEAKYAEALAVKPDWPAEYAIAYIRALQGDYAGALEWTDRMARAPAPSRKITMGLWWEGFYRWWLGEPAEAVRLAGELRCRAREDGIPVWERNADLLEAWARFDLGDRAQALALLEGAAEATAREDPQDSGWSRGMALYYRGVEALRSGDRAAAEAAVEALDREAARPVPDRRREARALAALLHAEALLARGDFQGAVTAARRAQWPSIAMTWTGLRIVRHNEPWLHDQAARALAAAGRTGEAIAEYERLAAFDPAGPSRRLVHPLYHLRLSALYERAGERAKAAASCRRFLELWKGADGARPEAAEARARLARCAG